MRLAGKTAIVVGGGQTPGATIGNGRATVLRFAQEGARIAVLDKNLDSAQETVDMIAAQDSSAGAALESFALPVDVNDESSVEDSLSEAIERLGELDILHNNVGIGGGDGPPVHIRTKSWDRIFETNTRSIMLTCRTVLPHMRERRSGVITNISSIAAIADASYITAYKTSKAAVNAYTQALASSNAKYNIRANVIMPGLMETPMAIEGSVAAGQDRERVIATRNAAVPLGGRMGSAWDIANAALYLASDEAQFVTGVLLPVDGGQSVKVG